MTAIQRVRVFNQGRVEAPAAKVWAWLTDWAGTKRGTQAGGAGATSFSGITLIGGEDEIPRTRVFEFPNLGEVRETLRGQDDAAMHLYYTIDGDGPLGMRNYLATTDVDPVSDTACMVTITARFDLAPGADVVAAKTLIDNAHMNAVIATLRKVLEQAEG